MLHPQIKDDFWSLNCSMGLYVSFLFLLLLVWKLYIHCYFSGYFSPHTWQRQSTATIDKDQENSPFLLVGLETGTTSLEKSLILYGKVKHVVCPVTQYFQSYMLGKHLNLCTKTVNSSIVAILKIFRKFKCSLVIE